VSAGWQHAFGLDATVGLARGSALDMRWVPAACINDLRHASDAWAFEKKNRRWLTSLTWLPSRASDLDERTCPKTAGRAGPRRLGLGGRFGQWGML